MPALSSAANFLLFQTGWFASVLSAAALLPWIGAVTAIAVIAVHLWRAPQYRSEIALIVAATIVGTLWDSMLVAFNHLHYSAGMIAPFLAPYWIILMWALFATTLNVSLRWLKGRIAVATIAGAVGGPLAYYAGYRFGAVEIAEIGPTMALLSIGWAVLTPLLLVFARRFDGFARTPDAGEVA